MSVSVPAEPPGRPVQRAADPLEASGRPRSVANGTVPAVCGDEAARAPAGDPL